MLQSPQHSPLAIALRVARVAHRAEFVESEGFAVQAGARLAEQHGRAQRDAHHQRDKHEQRREDDERGNRQREIKRAFAIGR